MRYKYKIGDKVKIKTYESMKREYGVNEYGTMNVKSEAGFIPSMERSLCKLNNNRILTIQCVNQYSKDYRVEEIKYYWTDDMIECLVEEYTPPIPIHSRFEILDIRD